MSVPTNRYLAELRAAKSGPQIAALFDFDGTIIAGYSVFALLREKLQRRRMSPGEACETLDAIVRYAAGKIRFADLMTLGAKYMKGVSVENYVQFGEELYEKRLAPRIYPETRALIKAHQAKGHTVAIVSSATVYQVGPTARDLDIERVLCSHYEIADGVFTGDYVRPLCFGPGKVQAVEALAAEQKLDLQRSYFYSDSDDDIELLDRVGHPRPLNPNGRLRALAVQRGWPVEEFHSRGTPALLDYARGLSPTPMLIGAILAGLPILALTRSARETANFVLGTFGDYASALVGINLDLHGERNLWIARPCVFLFNHQSQADVLILSKLLRQDIAGIGKKELRNTPVLGRLLELGGMVFIDRKNTPDAIKAMAPLVEAIRRDGKSVCMAPEGSRTSTAKLAPFKKGAFHLAMQAGVPIVPVVIHNAGDVQPKHEIAMRPATVRVDVLPPVSTGHWRPRTIASNVREVRNLFLRTLGQAEERASRGAPRAAREPAVPAPSRPPAVAVASRRTARRRKRQRDPG